MARHDEILELNRDQKISETDTFSEERYRQFVRHLPYGTRAVLDVGCNNGRGGAVMKAHVPNLHITGIDCIPERIEALNDIVYEQRICGFLGNVPLEAETFDAVVAGEFIEHVAPEEVYCVLCEMFRVLRLKGTLLLTTPNPGYLKNRLCGTSVLGGAHLTQHHIGSLIRRLRDIGFSKVKVMGSGRVSAAIGERFPFRAVYGSYLVKARKW